jgi:hypothetical protein
VTWLHTEQCHLKALKLGLVNKTICKRCQNKKPHTSYMPVRIQLNSDFMGVHFTKRNNQGVYCTSSEVWDCYGTIKEGGYTIRNSWCEMALLTLIHQPKHDELYSEVCMKQNKLTCWTPVMSAKSSVGFHRPRSLVATEWVCRGRLLRRPPDEEEGLLVLRRGCRFSGSASGVITDGNVTTLLDDPSSANIATRNQ